MSSGFILELIQTTALNQKMYFILRAHYLFQRANVFRKRTQ